MNRIQCTPFGFWFKHTNLNIIEQRKIEHGLDINDIKKFVIFLDENNGVVVTCKILTCWKNISKCLWIKCLEFALKKLFSQKKKSAEGTNEVRMAENW